MLNTEPLFRQLIGGFFLSRYILRGRALAGAFFSAADEYLSDAAPSSIEEVGSQQLSRSLAAAMNEVLCTPSFNGEEGLSGILERVFAIPEVRPTRRPITADLKITTENLDLEFMAKGLRFEVKSVDSPRLPLFFHEVVGNIVKVFINSSHPFLREGENAVHLARKLALSITLTRIELYGDDEVLGDFFSRLTMNDKVVARKHLEIQLKR